MHRNILAFLLIALSAPLWCESREGFLNVPGGPVWYRVSADANAKGIPILTVHGGPGGGSCGFTPLLPLAAGRKVVLYDQLGSGRSGRPADRTLWRVERFVEELDAVRKQLGLKRVHLMGHSWGGALVAQYAITKGTRGIESLILASPLLSTADWIRDAEELRKQLPAEVQQTLRRHEQNGTTDSAEYRKAEQEFTQRFVRRNRNTTPNPDCAGSAFNRIIYEQMWGPSEFHATGSLMTFDLTPHLNKLRVPVLLIVGEFDEARPATAAKYQKAIPGAKLEVIPGSAHSLFNDQPAQSIQALTSFIDSVERSRKRPQ